MQLAGLVMLGYMSAKMAAIAAKTPNEDFCKDKLKTAHFYMTYHLAETNTYARRIENCNSW
jgi:hypothetical protein